VWAAGKSVASQPALLPWQGLAGMVLKACSTQRDTITLAFV